VQKTKNSKIGLCTIFSFCHKESIKKKSWKSVAWSSWNSSGWKNERTDERGQNHRSLRSPTRDQKWLPPWEE